MALRDGEREIVDRTLGAVPHALRAIADLLPIEKVKLLEAARLIETGLAKRFADIVLAKAFDLRTDEVEIQKGGLDVVDEAGPSAGPLIKS